MNHSYLDSPLGIQIGHSPSQNVGTQFALAEYGAASDMLEQDR